MLRCSLLFSAMDLTRRQTTVLCASILVVALCGITYELLIGAVSSYLLGNSVYQFSIIIGLFMFAMGMGSFVSRFIKQENLVRVFVVIEVLVALMGGICSLTLFLTFSTVPNVYHVVMYGFVILIGAMVGIEIPILTRILATQKDIKDALSDVFSLDYIGALIGSLIFPLLLLPHLGLIRSSFAIGLFNISVAILNAWVFRSYFARPRRVMVVTALLFVALILAITFGSFLTRFAGQKLYMFDVIHREQSLYQRVILTKSAVNGEHRLYIDGHIQFAERDEHRYHEALVHPLMSQEGEVKSVLILGGGDGVCAREVFKWEGVESIDLVDIDPEITRICSELPQIVKLNEGALTDERLTLHHTDAFQYVRDTEKRYDRIIVDLPDPHNEVLNKLYSQEFYFLLRQILTPGGGMVSQCSSPLMTRRVYWCIGKSMEAGGWKLQSYHAQIPSFGVWGFHLAFPEEAPVNLEKDYPKNLRYLTKEVFEASQVFPNDIARVETPVNSMLEPLLYHIYNNELRR